MRRLRRQGVALVSLAAAFGLLGLSPAAAKRPGSGGGDSSGPSYQIVELDSADGLFPGGAEDINNAGLIVGQVYNPMLDENFAACWTVEKSGKTVTSTLHLLDGYLACGVSDSGEIVGDRNGQAVYWPNRNAAPMTLPAPQNSTFSRAIAINGNGVICGWSVAQPDGFQSAVLWRINIELVDGQPTPTVWGPLVLPQIAGVDQAYSASDISDNDSNDAARVVGGTYLDNAFTWTVISQPDGSLALDAGPTILDVTASAYGVNNTGLTCGRVQLDGAVWDATSTQILDNSGTVTGSSGRESFGSVRANAINANGVIVGSGSPGLRSAAVTWPSPTGSMIVLDKFLQRTAISELEYAWAVNDSGYIVGSGRDANRGIGLGFLAIPK